jgi:hypothetical protein
MLREDDDVHLIGTQHLAINDDQVRDEIERIAPKLLPAVTRDIADKGQRHRRDHRCRARYRCRAPGDDAAAGVVAVARGGRAHRPVRERGHRVPCRAQAASPTSSCRRCSGCASIAWYLHREDQRLFVKETENLSRQIERNAKEVPQPKIDQALINRLTGILQPDSKIGLPGRAGAARSTRLRLSGPRTLIVIKPDGKVPPSELQNFFDYQQEKNNLLVLTGQDSMLADAVEDRLRELYAIEQIHKRLKSGDTLFEEARDRFEEAEDRFARRCRRLQPGLLPCPIPSMAVTSWPTSPSTTASSSARAISPPRRRSRRCWPARAPTTSWWPNWARATSTNASRMAEEYLWPSGKDNRRTPWKDVATRAKSSPSGRGCRVRVAWIRSRPKP